MDTENASGNNEAEYWFRKGNEFYKDKNYEEAVKCYEKATQLDPQYADAFHDWGNALCKLAEIKQDYALFRNAFEKYKEAVRLYETGTDTDIDKASVFHNWGLVLSELAKIKQDYALFQSAFEKFDEAIRLYKTYVGKASVFHNWGIALFELARIKLDYVLFNSAFEKYEEAIRLYETGTGTDTDIDKASVFHNWGIALFELARIKLDYVLFNRAFEKYEKASQLDPENALIFNNWGDELCKLAEIKLDYVLFNKAFEKYYKAVRLYKANADKASVFNKLGYVISNLAGINENYALFQSAFEEYGKAVRLYETDKDKASVFHNWGDALSNLARISEDESLFKKAFAKYYKATRLEPKNIRHIMGWAEALFYLAKIKQDESLFGEVFDKYKEATELEPENFYPIVCWGYALYYLAKIKQDESLFREAIGKYEEVAPLKQKFFWLFGQAEALYDLAKIKQDKSSFEEAVDKYNKAIKDDEATRQEGKPYASFKRGIALASLAKINGDKNLEEAIKSFRDSKKDILDILTILDEDDREKIIKIGILHSLLDYDDNDTFFKETTKNLTPEQREEYKEIYIRSIFIISLLHINNENNKNEKLVAHYSKKDISQKLLFDSTSNFRLNAINYSNDPSEGKTLLDFLYEEENRPSDEKLDTEYEAFAGCFTFNYDSLNQFRLYGKEDGTKEGTGLSLVFRKNFFSTNAKPAFKSQQTNSPEKEKLSLFRCIYIDPQLRTGQPIATVGQKEESLFHKEDIEKHFEGYNDKMKGIIRKQEIEKQFKDYNDKMKDIIEQVKNKIKELKKLIENKNFDSAIVGQLLLNLRYLVKDIAFKEEQECRMIKILNLTKRDGIEIDDFKQMYFKYLPKVSDHIDRIYFGPKAEGIELFKSMLKYKGLDKIIHCEKSKNPLA